MSNATLDRFLRDHGCPPAGRCPATHDPSLIPLASDVLCDCLTGKAVGVHRTGCPLPAWADRHDNPHRLLPA